MADNELITFFFFFFSLSLSLSLSALAAGPGPGLALALALAGTPAGTRAGRARECSCPWVGRWLPGRAPTVVGSRTSTDSRSQPYRSGSSPSRRWQARCPGWSARSRRTRRRRAPRSRSPCGRPGRARPGCVGPAAGTRPGRRAGRRRSR